MGRSKKNKRLGKSNQNYPNKRKNGKHERFWIEDCPDTELPDDCSARQVMDVLITRVELNDDYQRTTNETSVECSEKRDDEKTETKLESKPEETITKSKGDDKPQAYVEPPSKERNDQSLNAQKIVEAVNCSSPSSDIAATKAEGRQKKDDIAPKNGETKQKEEEPTPLIMIKRTKSAKGKLRKFFLFATNFKPLPDGDCGDGIKNPYPKDEVADKFWSQRRRLFTRFDEGVQLDKESWYSVTPEAIANHIAASMVANEQEHVTILDMFCGCGGNAIAFARREEVKTVVCVDSDMGKLKKAAHNAKCYGIAREKMVFIHSGACEVLSCYNGGELSRASDRQEECPSLENHSSDYYKFGGLNLLPSAIDMAFVSPPWGGMDYVKVGKRNYDLKCIQIEEESETIDGETLLERTSHALGHRPIALFLPKNVNGTAIGNSVVKAGYEGSIVLEQNVLNGKLKTVTAYFGVG